MGLDRQRKSVCRERIDEGQLNLRRHPDLFTAEQAACYLHLDEMHSDDGRRDGNVTEKALRTLRTLIEQRCLAPTPIGKHNMFHRVNLDRCVEKLMSNSSVPTPPPAPGGPRRGRLRQQVSAS